MLGASFQSKAQNTIKWENKSHCDIVIEAFPCDGPILFFNVAVNSLQIYTSEIPIKYFNVYFDGSSLADLGLHTDICGFAPDNVNSNDCFIGYFTALNGSTYNFAVW